MELPRKMREYSIAVSGQGGSGTRSLLRQISGRYFGDREIYDPTGEEWRRCVNVDGQPDLINLINFPSLPEYVAFREQVIKSCDVVVVVFSITFSETFKSIRELYADIFHARKEAEEGKCKPGLPVFLVGNKLDMEKQRVVSENEAAQLAREMDMEYREVSCKTGAGIEELEEAIVRKARRWREEVSDKSVAQAPAMAVKAEKSERSKRRSFVESVKGLLAGKKPVKQDQAQ